MDDTLTIALEGSVSLTAFAEAVRGFTDLVDALTKDAGSADGIEWVIDGLQAGSAIATIRGIGPQDQVARVIRAYEDAGAAMQQAELGALSARVQRPANALLKVLAGGLVEEMRFETEQRDVMLRRTDHLRLVREAPAVAPPVPPALGAVTGRIQTLTDRGGLRFTLFDQLHDKAVSCYLRQGYEEIMRGAWGHLAEVIGMVSRDPESGRALAVRNVTAVRLTPEGEPEGWRRAMGAAPARTSMSAEHAIRLVRDAW